MICLYINWYFFLSIFCYLIIRIRVYFYAGCTGKVWRLILIIGESSTKTWIQTTSIESISCFQIQFLLDYLSFITERVQHWEYSMIFFIIRLSRECAIIYPGVVFIWSQMWDINHQSICRFKSLICRIKTINRRIKSINRCIKSINHRIKLSFCIVNPLHQTVISFSQSVNLLFHSIASFCNIIS